MFAVEFQATVRDDKIEIPQEYKGQFRNLVRVIVLAENVKRPVAT